MHTCVVCVRMSGTYKTAPWRRQILRDPRFRVERHDHRDGGPCTLPSTPSTSHVDRGQRVRCGWDPSDSFLGTNHCGCPMCTRQDKRRQDRRRSRHEARDMARRARYGADGLS